MKPSKASSITPSAQIAVTPLPVLDGLIVFSDGRSCKAAPTTEGLLDNLLVQTEDGHELVLGNIIAPDRFRPAFGTLRMIKHDENFREAVVAVKGLWQGLKMAHIASSGEPFSDSGVQSYGFREPFDKVRTVLNSMGFELDAKGNQDGGPLGEDEYASLYVSDGITILQCEPFGAMPTVEESARKAAASR